MHLLHRHARVALDRDERLARRLDAVGLRHADEMPRGVLHVVRIHGLMHLELLPALLEFVRVVEREPALPEAGLGIGLEFDDPLKAATDSFGFAAK